MTPGQVKLAMTSMSDLDWAEVPQDRRSAGRIAVTAGGLFLRLVLRQNSGDSMLEMRVNVPLGQKLGWMMGDRLGFSVGVGENSGHLKFYPLKTGRKLSGEVHTQGIMIARFVAPSEWKALKGDLKTQAFSVEGAALVVKVAAVHSDFIGPVPAETGPAGHEVAA